ncbi:unnamed protein product [Brassica oleracea var. botrytis]
MNPAKDPCWKRIIGNDSHITISELGDMLENDPLMPYERRLQLALIMIVDGVLYFLCFGCFLFYFDDLNKTEKDNFPNMFPIHEP